MRYDTPDIPPLIWERPERATRGPKPAHSRREIALAAIGIADADGMDAVSMRGVAGRIGTGTASLYRYVATKDELLDLMFDEVLGETPPEAHSGDWRTDLRAIAHQTRQTILRHPWMAVLTAGRPTLGPNSLRFNEHVLTAVDGLGLDIDRMGIAVDTVIAYVRGYALRDLAEAEARRRSGLDFNQYGHTLGRYARTIMARGEHPRLARYWLDAEVPHAADRQDRAFAIGLDQVLDGIAATIG